MQTEAQAYQTLIDADFEESELERRIIQNGETAVSILREHDSEQREERARLDRLDRFYSSY